MSLTYFYGNDLFFQKNSVRAFGELTVDFHVPPGDPIFTVNNMAPGNSVSRDVDVTNGSPIARMVSVKGIRKGGVGDTPKLETVLDIKITDGVNSLYGDDSPTGPKTVQDFFNESAGPNGIQLNVINPGNAKTYTFVVTFPESAGNEFQNKSVIFDLTFGVLTSNKLVINEVYYKVDSSHGLDSPKDRGILSQNGNKVMIQVQGNDAGSKNAVTVNQSQACSILQSNTAVINNNVIVNSNTGGDSQSFNTGTSTSIVTGSVQSIVSIFNGGNVNIANGCGSKLGQNDEWVEIFNPTDQDIILKNWTLSDNGGTVKINSNTKIKAGGFALISKSTSTWSYWSENPHAVKVTLGSNIGDGLNNAGDRLILRNPSGTEADRMSWGTDTSGFTPFAINPEISIGSSTNRVVPGLDTNSVSDWISNSTPNPGN